MTRNLKYNFFTGYFFRYAGKTALLLLIALQSFCALEVGNPEPEEPIESDGATRIVFNMRAHSFSSSACTDCNQPVVSKVIGVDGSEQGEYQMQALYFNIESIDLGNEEHLDFYSIVDIATLSSLAFDAESGSSRFETISLNVAAPDTGQTDNTGGPIKQASCQQQKFAVCFEGNYTGLVGKEYVHNLPIIITSVEEKTYTVSIDNAAEEEWQVVTSATNTYSLDFDVTDWYNFSNDTGSDGVDFSDIRLHPRQEMLVLHKGNYDALTKTISNNLGKNIKARQEKPVPANARAMGNKKNSPPGKKDKDKEADKKKENASLDKNKKPASPPGQEKKL